MSATKYGETHTETWELANWLGSARVTAQCNGTGFLLEKRDYGQSLHAGLAQQLMGQTDARAVWTSINLSREEAEALVEVLERFLSPSKTTGPTP